MTNAKRDGRRLPGIATSALLAVLLLSALVLIGVGILRGSEPFQNSFYLETVSPDGRFVAAHVLTSNGRRKDRSLALCEVALKDKKDKWLMPLKWGQINLFETEWIGPDVLRVACADYSGGQLPSKMQLKDLPVVLIFDFQSYEEYERRKQQK